MNVPCVQRECDGKHSDSWRRRFRLGRILGLSLFTLAVGTGCFPGTAPPTPAKPRAGQVVRVSVPDFPAVRELLRRHGNSWTDRSGATVEIVGPETDADLTIFSPAELPKLVSTEKIVQLPESLSDQTAGFDVGYFLRPYRLRLINWQLKKYAMPIFGDSLLFAWRADLLENPSHKKAIEARLNHPLSPEGPATWQEVETIAQYFHETAVWMPGDAGTGKRPSLPPLPISAEEMDRLFHAVAAPFARRAINEELLSGIADAEKRMLIYDYQFNLDTGEAQIADRGFVAALSLLHGLKACRAAGRAAHPSDALNGGTAVASLITLADIPELRKAENAGKGIRFGISRVPGSTTCYGNGKMIEVAGGNFVPYLGSGGWMGAITTSAKNADTALEFLAYIVSPTVSLEIVYEPSWGSGPTRTTHLELSNRAGWYNYGLSEARTNQLIAALEKSINPPIANPAYRLRVSDQAAYLQAEAEQLGKSLEGDVAPDMALKELAERWRTLGGPEGKAKRMREYKQSVGLN